MFSPLKLQKILKKKIDSSEAMSGIKLKLCRNDHNISHYKLCVFFIAVVQVFFMTSKFFHDMAKVSIDL